MVAAKVARLGHRSVASLAESWAASLAERSAAASVAVLAGS
jgi:hypothetical protein